MSDTPKVSAAEALEEPCFGDSGLTALELAAGIESLIDKSPDHWVRLFGADVALALRALSAATHAARGVARANG